MKKKLEINQVLILLETALEGLIKNVNSNNSIVELMTKINLILNIFERNVENKKSLSKIKTLRVYLRNPGKNIDNIMKFEAEDIPAIKVLLAKKN